ncbi:hypothetical protein C5167_020073 [Papaver somniferum]|uniref:Uncharacterized protein n=1 Tax=Papaver somniferum TaxID=3469 RepID=A0A4Y7IVC1_PAPSO|nr:hypothetical protein C5167_020073 [Papaver somniferum]
MVMIQQDVAKASGGSNKAAEEQKRSGTCPVDLKEAVTSIVFAAPRCADIPELVDIRKHFTAKYGKEFITSALELRPDSGVSRQVSV